MNKPIGDIFGNKDFYNQQGFQRRSAFTLPSMKDVEYALNKNFGPQCAISSVNDFAQSKFENSELKFQNQVKYKQAKIKVLRISNDLINHSEVLINQHDDSQLMSTKEKNSLIPMTIDDNEEEKIRSENQFCFQNIKAINQIDEEIEFCLTKRSSAKKEGTKAMVEIESSSHCEAKNAKNSNDRKNSISLKSEATNDNSETLATRCDVIYKTILRDFRRHYQNKFLESADFSKRNKRKVYSQKLVDFTRYIYTSYFPDETDESKVAECVKSLIYPKENTMLHNCLYKFSIQKAMSLIKNKYLFKLFQAYYEKIESGEISLPSTMQKNRDAYLKGFQMLLKEGSM